MMSVLISARADLNAKDRFDGRRSLHYASWNGHAGTAEVLIKAGTDLNAKDGMLDRTPLHRASEYGQAGTAEVLIKAGCTPAPTSTPRTRTDTPPRIMPHTEAR